MSRYIDADAFDERVRISVGLVEEELTDDYKDGVRCTLELLKTEQTADVVEVVRCKDCIHWEFRDGWDHCRFFDWLLEDDNGYCHFGERREDET